MKINRLISLLAILLVTSSCGKPILFDNAPIPGTSQIQEAPVLSGTLLYLDAAYVNGSYSAPPSGCSTVWSDLSGNSNTGSLTNFNCTGSSGWSGTGLKSDPYTLNFDGSGYVVTTLDAQPSALTETTWEIWIKPTRLNHGSRQQLMSTDDGGFDRSLLIEASTSNFAVFTGTSGSGVWTPVSADLNQWQHITLVYSSSDIKLYKNGTPYSRGSAFGGAGATSNMLTIGANPAFGEQIQGSITLFTVYNRALSQAEITEHCNAYASRFNGVTCN